MIVQSLGSLTDLQPGWLPSSAAYGSLSLYGNYTADYWEIFRTQPNVRTVVEFLARNVAQLGLHVFRRVSDTDRERLTDHGLARLIGKPNPRTTRYRLIESLMIDLGVYFSAYWLKLKATDGSPALLRVPPELVQVTGGLVPTAYTVNLSGREPLKLTPDQIVHFRGHGTTIGLSPLETLRRILAEEASAGDYREGFWRNSARMSGFVTRPATAPEWSPAARDRFTAEFSALYAGAANSGKTAVLEEGMAFSSAQFSAEDSQYYEGRKLTREECARAYHVPLPMVGILDHATFSNIESQHKQLYTDCLGPWLTMLQEDMELQLLPEFSDREGIYLEFNIMEKLKGSFEEQATSLSAAVGRPWLTADEARARQNLPSLGGDASQLVTPLNVLTGGQASPQNPTGPNAPKALRPPELKAAADDQVDTTYVRLRGRHVEKWAQVLAKFFDRQRSAVLGALKKSSKARTKASAADVFDSERWDKDLQGDLLALSTATSTAFGKRVADALGGEFDPDRLAAWLAKHVEFAAQGINDHTLDLIRAALEEDDPEEAIGNLFDVARDSRSAQIAQTSTTTLANFGAHEGAEHSGAKEKTWIHNSRNARSSHAAMNGQTVKLPEDFSIGAPWPGSPALGADDNANCQCSLAFGG